MSNCRKIIHVDMDCFYAAVEMRDFPEYRGKPLAVGGSRQTRGVISTSNYEARKYGVRSAMPTQQALKLCPHLILVAGRMQVYKDISKQIRAIFQKYTDIIEPLSLDEAYLDVTDCKLYQGSATLIAEAIRDEIFRVTQLTASAGVAPIKFLAKVASDINKPNGQCVIPPEQVDEFLKTLPLRKIPGVGKVTEEKLLGMGLKTCADVQAYDRQTLLKRFGKFGEVIINRSFGCDDRAIVSHRERKSVGVETTLLQDIFTLEQCQSVLVELIDELKSRVERNAPDREIQKQVVKLKFSDFVQTTVEHQTDSINEPELKQLLEEAFERGYGKGIRLVGVSVGLHSTAQCESNVEMKQLGFNFNH
ncbi:DNA polymerase IV [Parashewanella curva]|uniref:DNA polymerase IV n=1 Tax=Parashewanella curva TaxID=2338552 RepID=A0A3L8PVT5_9GAMM|nr:DNA polymerase IV [Parashewanella curva]RLV59547.1 DNA polymerase IV [Parashewanella curva]